MSEYGNRDLVSLGDCYTKHVSAMTTEALHAKSDIAAELAWRDCEIDRLTAQLAERDAEIKRLEASHNELAGIPLGELHLYHVFCV